TNRADFWNGINTSGYIVNKVPSIFINNITGCGTALVIGSTGQAWPTDHITGSINIRHCRAVILIHFNLTATIGGQANVFQAQLIGITGTAIAPQETVCFDLLTGFKVQNNTLINPFNPLIFFIMAN